MYVSVKQTLFLRDTCKGKYVLCGDEIFEVDDTAAAILSHCDGSCDIDGLVSKMALEGFDRADLSEALPSFVDSMVLDGVLQLSDTRGRVEAVYAGDHPCGAIIEITYRCNMRCSFCIASAGAAESEALDELDWPFYEQLLDELGRWAPAPVNITGGEPLLRADLVLKMAQKARSVGLEPLLLTNATLADDRLAGQLWDAGIREVQVSLDSPDPAVHNTSRGVQGTHAATMRGIEALRRAGMEVSAAAVISRRNFHQLHDIGESLRGFGRHTKISEILPLGRGDAHPDLLSPDELLKLHMFQAELPDGRLARRLIPRETCSIGTTPAITPRGDVYPCFSMRFPEFRVGNIREQTLTEMWRTSPVLKELSRWRIDDIEGCRDCPTRLVCGGGCRAVAYAYHGTIYKPDPYHCLASRRFCGELMKRGDDTTKKALGGLLISPGQGAAKEVG